MPAALKTCMFGFRTPAGEWVRVVSGESVFEAASKALEFFASDGWYGPQPRSETALEVSAVGGGRAYHVRCGRVIEWRSSYLPKKMAPPSAIPDAQRRFEITFADDLSRPTGATY